MEIGDRIKELRKKEKLNQIKFCNIINLGQSRLSEIESNKTKPSFETLLSIKENFNISLDWLATGESNEIDEIDELYYNGYSSQEELSSIESNLIQIFRKLDDRDKKEILAFVKLKNDLGKKNSTLMSSRLKNGEDNTGEDAATIETA